MPKGELKVSWGMSGTEPGRFTQAHQFGFDTQDRILLCDRANCRLQFFGRDVRFLLTWDDVYSPNDVNSKPEGLIPVAVQGRGGAVSFFSEDGEKICRFLGMESGLRGV